MRVAYEPIPSGCALSVIRLSPGPAISFVVPAHKRVIRRYEGTRAGGDGRYAKHEIEVPAILYTFNPGHSSDGKLGMYILKSIGDSTLMGKEVRIGNTYGQERICWGHVPGCIPIHMRSKVNAFWEAPFNDDLTPYPQIQDKSSWIHEKVRTDPMFAALQRKQARRESRSSAASRKLRTPSGGNIQEHVRYVVTDVLHKRTIFPTFERIVNRYDECSNEEYRVVEEHHPNPLTRERLRKMRENAQTIYELAERKRRDRNSKIDTTAEILYLEALSVIEFSYGITSRKKHDRLLYQTYKQRVREFALKIKEYDEDLAVEYVNYMRWLVISQVVNNVVSNNPIDKLYEDWYMKEKKKVRKDWWEDGGWTRYGDNQDLYNKVFGSQFLCDERQFSGVAWIRLGDKSDELAEELNKYMKGHGITSMYLPVWRLPDNSVFGYVGDVGYVGSLESGDQMVNLRLYNEKDEAILTAAKEIFG